MTLDDIAADPNAVKTLTREQAFSLHASALSIAWLLTNAMLGEPKPEEPSDVALTTEQAALVLGISPSTLRHGASSTHRGLRIQNGTRKIAWSRLKIEKFMKRR